MQSPHAAAAAGKLLILLALGTASQISTGVAAPRCPSGQMLRVSLGTCVPKAENLAILSKYAAKPRHARTQAETAAPKPAENETATGERVQEAPPVELAARDAPRPEQKAAPEQSEAPASPFGSLFVGAFRSAVTTGLSAFK